MPHEEMQVEFSRRLNGYDAHLIPCGNRVQIEDQLGNLVDYSEHSLTWACGTAAVAGDNQIVPAPAAGYRIVVSSFVIQNESAVATTMMLRDGASSRIRCLGQNQGDGLAMVFNRGDEWRLSEASALNLNLSGANSCGYSIAYYLEDA